MSNDPSPLSFEILRPTAVDELPWIVHIPHASRTIPPEVRETFVASADELSEELDRMTDDYTDQLFEPARGMGATLFVNRVSRLVVDPERFRDDEREHMAKAGMGAVRLRTATGGWLRPATFPSRDREALLLEYYDPYARALEDLVREFAERFGCCLIIDGHSYTADNPFLRLADSRAPSICLGHEEPHAPGGLIASWRSGALAGVFSAENAPYAGSYVPLAFYGRSETRIWSVMIEVNKSFYLRGDSGGVPDLNKPGWRVVSLMLQEASEWIRRRASVRGEGFHSRACIDRR